MCKNMMIAGIKPQNTKKAWDFLMKAREGMTENDKDGIGYAAMSKSTGIWGERWRWPNDSWRYRPDASTDSVIEKQLEGVLETPEKRYNAFGDASPDDTMALIYHSRFATCEKSLENVHPFVRENVAMIHNGVIGNDDKLTKLYSTCDSEVILNEYYSSGVTAKPEDIEKVAQALVGSYACGILSTDASGRKYLDIFRNSYSDLYAVWIPELETTVFCTRVDIIRGACKLLGWKYGSAHKVRDEIMVRLDAETGEMVSKHKFKANFRYTTNDYSGSNYNGRGYSHYDYDTEWDSTNRTWVKKEAKEKKSLAVVPDTQAKTEETRSQPNNTNPSGPTSCPVGTSEPTTEEKALEELANPFYYQGEGYGMH